MSSRPSARLDEGAIARMQIAASVKNKLMSTPGAFKIPAQGLEVFVLRDFLTHAECATLCDMIDALGIPVVPDV